MKGYKKKVLILLSTYNGEKYISEQLDSLLKQTYSNFKILIRDDGSTDSTASIIQKYADRYNCIQFYVGKNIGAAYSFFHLLQNAPKNFDYYAFCDQDDVWKKDKISNAIAILDESGTSNQSIMYCSKVELVNSYLRPIKAGIVYNKINPSFENALIENICIGCTCVINNTLAQKLVTNIPSFVIMHDFWIYLVASCFGTVIYDTNSYILYRQHDNNTIGISSSKLQAYLKRIKNYNKHKGMLSNQVFEFRKLYTDIPEEKKITINLFLKAKSSIKTRLWLCVFGRLYRQRKIDNIIFKILILLGRI